MLAQPHTADRLPVLLHLHLPKTAGMALNDVILDVYGHPEWQHSDDERLINGIYYVRAGIERQFHPDEALREALASRDVRAVVGHFPYGIHHLVAGPYQYVTVLRHPIERVVSLYYHIKTWYNTELHKEVVDRRLSLDEFVVDLKYSEIDNGQVRRISGLDAPYGKCDRSMLEVAIRNLTAHMAVAGLTERYAQSVLLMKHNLAWPRLPELRRKNVNQARPENATLPQATYSLILERNQLDMELYRVAAARLQHQIDKAGPAYDADLTVHSRRRANGGDFSSH